MMSNNRCIDQNDVMGYFGNDYDCEVGADVDSEDDGEMPPPHEPLIYRREYEYFISLLHTVFNMVIF